MKEIGINIRNHGNQKNRQNNFCYVFDEVKIKARASSLFL